MTDPPKRPYGDLPPAPRAPEMSRGPGGDDPLVPADFSSWMGKIVDAVGRSWRPLILLQLVLAVPLAILLALFEHAAGSRTGLTVTDSKVHWTFDHPGTAIGLGVGLGVVALVVGALVQLASLWVVIRQAADRDCPAKLAFRFAVDRVAPLIGWQIVAGVIIVLGLVALVVPGIYFAVVLIPTLLGVVGLERRGLRRCFELVRGQFFALFGRCCVALLIVAAYSELDQVIVNGIFGRDATGWDVQLVASALQLPLEVAGLAFLVITYVELRGKRVATSTADLLAELG